MTDRHFELLAPAGDEQCLRAAVANGADAVYFGAGEFNARRRATNFSLAGLPETIRYLHEHNVRAYVAFNTLVFSEELERAAANLVQIVEAGADAIIVQDLGVAALIRRLSPSMSVHASTQTTQTHAAGMSVLRELGISRVILARELSLEQISRISAQAELELEAFVHGAMCVSYSGQCLASESLWGRSGNRGLCAQACRLPYRLVVDGREVERAGGDHILSPHDLAAFSRIGELMQAGVSSFKIEGRLKSAQYVACVVRIYREAIDAASLGQAYKLLPERQEELAQSFSRGFTCGFLDGPRHQEFIGAASPKSRGLRIGRVVEITGRSVVVELESATGCTLKPGDGVVFESPLSSQEEQGGRVYSVEPRPASRRGNQGVSTQAGSRFELTFGRGDLDLRKVPVGCALFKSDDPAVARRIETSMRCAGAARPAPVHARVFVAAGQRLRLQLSDQQGSQVEVLSDQPLESAERRPLTLDVLREQLGRLGDTPFVLASVELHGPDGPAESLPVMAPKSVLNHLRRQAARALFDARELECRHRASDPNALEQMRAEIAARAGSPTHAPGPRQISVLVRDLDQLAAIVQELAEISATALVYADLSQSGRYTQAVQLARAAKLRVGLATPQVLHPGEEHLLDAIVRADPDAVLVRNWAALHYLQQTLPNGELIADFSFNIANELSADLLFGAGPARVTPGYDLNVAQLGALLTRFGPQRFELIVHGHVPMFLTAHCPAAAGLSAANDCSRCGQPCNSRRLHLRDRNGEDHPLRVDAAGRTVVFNAVSQSIVPVWDSFSRLPVTNWRVELLDESPDEACALLHLYVSLSAGNPDALSELGRRNAQKKTRARAGTLGHA